MYTFLQEENKIVPQLGGSKKTFHARLNREFERNGGRFARKSRDMLELELENRAAAADRVEARQDTQ